MPEDAPDEPGPEDAREDEAGEGEEVDADRVRPSLGEHPDDRGAQQSPEDDERDRDPVRRLVDVVVDLVDPRVLDVDLERPVAQTLEHVADLVRDLARDGAVLIDLRSPDDYASGHPTGAVHLAFGSKVGYWAGWVVPAGSAVVLIADDTKQALEARRQLLRVGIDAVAGYVDGGFAAWQRADLAVSRLPQMTVEQLFERLSSADRPAILDVRTAREFRDGHLDGAMLVPVGEVPVRIAELPARRPIATICEAGYRSSLASSLLERAGIGPVVNVVGGMSAYRSLEAAR